MALELVRRYDLDPNFVFATALLFVVFTFGFVVGNAYGSYSRVRSLQDVLSFFPVREGQNFVLVTRTGECFHTSEHCRGLRHAQQQLPKKACKVCFAGLCQLHRRWSEPYFMHHVSCVLFYAFQKHMCTFWRCFFIYLCFLSIRLCWKTALFMRCMFELWLCSALSCDRAKIVSAAQCALEPPLVSCCCALVTKGFRA